MVRLVRTFEQNLGVICFVFVFIHYYKCGQMAVGGRSESLIFILTVVKEKS